ncbi:T9SS C-terminal target domain-containing protein, partial [Aquimarina agarivorans]|uniref:T9SS C-terminal target domain-containing protein n=1 Tax=Aquimarina agarivorans TaxID=980584 RepID=UPI000248EA0F
IDNSSNDNPIGSTVTQDLLANDTLSDGTIPTPLDITLALTPPATTTNIVTGPSGNVIGFEVSGQGVWLYDESTGEIDFIPDAGLIGNPDSIVYTITDNDNGETASANVSVDYQEVPFADDELSTDNTQGDTVFVNILDGDTDLDGTIDPTSVDLTVPDTATNVITDLNGDVIGFTVPGEGVWFYDETTGNLSFDPIDGFTGNPTPITYVVNDNDGNTSNIANVAIEYVVEPPVPVDDSSTSNDTGNPVTLNVLANDTLSDGSTPTPADIIFDLVVPSTATNPIVGSNGNTIGFTVPGEGDWIYDETTGEITFVPEAGFTNDPTPVDYNITDVDTGVVSATPASITIDYEIELPVAENDASNDNATGSTATIDILANDMDPDGNLDPESVNLTPPSIATNIIMDADGDVIGFEVSGEGVWTYDSSTEELTFEPAPGFVLDPTPITYTVDDNDGNTSNPAIVVVDYIDVADLSLTKRVVDEAVDSEVLVGSEITFEIRVFNDGPADATGVRVNDLLPSGYDFVLYSSSVGTYDESTGEWIVGNLPSGGSENLLIDVLVNAPTNTAGEYFNVAEVVSSDIFDIDSVPNNNDGDQSEDDEDSTFVIPIVPMADLELTKEVVDGDVTPLIGTEVTFNITITNNGPERTTGVQVTDMLPSGYDFVLFSSSTGSYNEVSGIWNVGSLESGDTETLLIDALVLATGEYRNIAEVTASDVLDVDSVVGNNDLSEDDQDDAVVTPIESIADLSLEKVVVDNDVTPLVGEEITFRLTIRNDGPETATGVEVTDLLPSGYDFETFSSSTGSYNEVSGIWTVGNLESGDVETLLIDVTVEPSGVYLNTSEVSASNITDSDSTPGNGDINEDDYAEALTTPIQSVADLSITKTTVGGEVNAQPGDELRFQITVNNAGPDNATNVEAMDLLPVGFDYVQFSATSGSYDPITGIWVVDDVPANGSQTIFIDVIVKEPTNTPNEFVNSALITASDQIDPNSDVNSDASMDDLDDGIIDDDEASFPILVAIADLSLVKSIDNESPNVGDVITFTLSIANAGPDTASGVAIQDVLPIGFSQISDVSNSGTVTDNTIDWTNLIVPLAGLELTYSAVVNMPTLSDNEYLNIAQITSSNEFDPNSSPNNDDGDQSEDDEASFTIPTPTIDLSLVKSISETNPNVGETVTFTLTISNRGSYDATGVVVEDILPIGLTLDEASISNNGAFDGIKIDWTNITVPVGDTILTYDVIVEKPLDITDEYRNIAGVTGSDQIDSDPSNDQGEFTIPTPTIDLEIRKSVDNPDPKIGTQVVFTIEVENLSTVYEATNVEILDQLKSGYLFISSSDAAAYDVTTGIWNVGTLATSSTKTLDIVVEVLNSGEYGNEATVASSDQIVTNVNEVTGEVDAPALECATVYNEFSPNGDGKNDFLIIDCIDQFPNNKLTIYNRWGNIVYEKEGYDNTFEGIANGRATLYPNEKLPVGTYYYVLDLGDGSDPRAGWLYINR